MSKENMQYFWNKLVKKHDSHYTLCCWSDFCLSRTTLQLSFLYFYLRWIRGAKVLGGLFFNHFQPGEQQKLHLEMSRERSTARFHTSVWCSGVCFWADGQVGTGVKVCGGGQVRCEWLRPKRYKIRRKKAESVTQRSLTVSHEDR